MASGTSSWLRRAIASLLPVAVTAAMAACGGSTKPDVERNQHRAPVDKNGDADRRRPPPRPQPAGRRPVTHATFRVGRARPSVPRVHCHATTRARHARGPGSRRAADKPALAARATDDTVGPARSGGAAVCQVGTGHPRRRSTGLIVPDPLRDQFSIGWGNAGEGHRGTTIIVDACAGPKGAKWLAYAGGYYVRDPFCAPLIVAAHQQRRRVRIGVGKACPGQRPPPQPTQG